VPAWRQALAWVLPAMPAPITATESGVEVMGRVLPGAGELGTGRLGCGGCGACVRPGAPRTRSAQADDTARLAELPLDALERELPRLRDPHVVPDDGEDVDRGEEGVGEHRPQPGHHH